MIKSVLARKAFFQAEEGDILVENIKIPLPFVSLGLNQTQQSGFSSFEEKQENRM